MSANLVIQYDSNNSGGGWWLTDEDWLALEAAGWEVRWYKNDPFFMRFVDEFGVPRERFLGALAGSAIRRGLSKSDVIAEFEQITGQNSDAIGCECCGPPHRFDERDDDAKD